MYYNCIIIDEASQDLFEKKQGQYGVNGPEGSCFENSIISVGLFCLLRGRIS